MSDLYASVIVKQANTDISNKLKEEIYGYADDRGRVAFFSEEDIKELIEDLKYEGRDEDAKDLQELWEKYGEENGELVIWIR